MIVATRSTVTGDELKNIAERRELILLQLMAIILFIVSFVPMSRTYFSLYICVSVQYKINLQWLVLWTH